MHVFLIGGGREPEGVRAAHAPFTAAAGGGPVVVYALDEGEGVDAARWEGQLAPVAAHVVAISAERPPVPDDLDGAGGVYVAGGLTPAYHDVCVAAGTGWLERARELGLPYAGYSAGAAIAVESAILGGAARSCTARAPCTGSRRWATAASRSRRCSPVKGSRCRAAEP
jgi:cyanophycinase